MVRDFVIYDLDHVLTVSLQGTPLGISYNGFVGRKLLEKGFSCPHLLKAVVGPIAFECDVTSVCAFVCTCVCHQSLTNI